MGGFAAIAAKQKREREAAREKRAAAGDTKPVRELKGSDLRSGPRAAEGRRLAWNKAHPQRKMSPEKFTEYEIQGRAGERRRARTTASETTDKVVPKVKE